MKTIAFEIAEQLTALEQSGAKHRPAAGAASTALDRARLVFSIHQRRPGTIGRAERLHRAVPDGPDDSGSQRLAVFRPMAAHQWCTPGRLTGTPLSRLCRHEPTSPPSRPATLGAPTRCYASACSKPRRTIKSHDLTSRPARASLKTSAMKKPSAPCTSWRNWKAFRWSRRPRWHFAGLIKLVRAGVIIPNDTVVINCTGHTMPVERLILGEGWARNVTAPPVGEGAPQSKACPKGKPQDSPATRRNAPRRPAGCAQPGEQRSLRPSADCG